MNTFFIITLSILLIYFIYRLLKYKKGYVINLDFNKPIYSIKLNDVDNEFHIDNVSTYSGLGLTIHHGIHDLINSNDPEELIDILNKYKSGKLYPSFIKYKFNLDGHKRIYIIENNKLKTINFNSLIRVDKIDLDYDRNNKLIRLSYNLSDGIGYKYYLNKNDLSNYITDIDKDKEFINNKRLHYKVYLDDKLIYNNTYKDSNVTLNNFIVEG